MLDLAGGFTGSPKAVLLGGAAGGFLGADRLDVPLTFEDSRSGGYTLGSGVVMAFNDSVEYTAARQSRQGAAIMRMVVVEGV